MKTAEPKIIYLQIGEDVDISELKDYEFETNAITWCWERIHSNDIKYISKQSILALVDVEIDKHKAMQKKYLDNNLEYYGLAGAKISTLTELKQKIEEL